MVNTKHRLESAVPRVSNFDPSSYHLNFPTRWLLLHSENFGIGLDVSGWCQPLWSIITIGDIPIFISMSGLPLCAGPQSLPHSWPSNLQRSTCAWWVPESGKPFTASASISESHKIPFNIMCDCMSCIRKYNIYTGYDHDVHMWLICSFQFWAVLILFVQELSTREQDYTCNNIHCRCIWRSRIHNLVRNSHGNDRISSTFATFGIQSITELSLWVIYISST